MASDVVVALAAIGGAAVSGLIPGVMTVFADQRRDKNTAERVTIDRAREDELRSAEAVRAESATYRDLCVSAARQLGDISAELVFSGQVSLASLRAVSATMFDLSLRAGIAAGIASTWSEKFPDSFDLTLQAIKEFADEFRKACHLDQQHGRF